MSEHDKKDEMMKYEEWIRSAKSSIAHVEDDIIRHEQEQGGRGESNIIRY